VAIVADWPFCLWPNAHHRTGQAQALQEDQRCLTPGLLYRVCCKLRIHVLAGLPFWQMAARMFDGI